MCSSHSLPVVTAAPSAVAAGEEWLDAVVDQVPVRWDLCMRTMADLGVTVSSTAGLAHASGLGQRRCPA